MDDWDEIIDRIGSAVGKRLTLNHVRAIAGGCINRAAVLEGDGWAYFVKYRDLGGLEMFRAEAEGLRALGVTGTVRTPIPVCAEITARNSFLALEYVPIIKLSAAAAAMLGRHLAALHRTTQSRYGWHRDNTIGATPQPNTYADTWIEFLRARRLGFQLNLAADNGHRSVAVKGERLLARLESFFVGYEGKPSLLHGDLWHGNVGMAPHGEPIIFDPAVYFGDREADLAMTELFGGFPDSFYAAYREAWPLAHGYEKRRTLYNLYHVLNHLNLFGRGYLKQAEQMLDYLLTEAG